MKVLVACEESQEVCKAFREKGHEAYSCDIQHCALWNHMEWHIVEDVRQIIGGVQLCNRGRETTHDSGTLGFYHCPSALHLPDQQLRRAAFQRRPHRERRGKDGKRLGGKRIFHAVLQCASGEKVHRKPHADAPMEASTVEPDHRAVDVWGTVAETDLPLAPGPAGIEADTDRDARGLVGGQQLKAGF